MSAYYNSVSTVIGLLLHVFLTLTIVILTLKVLNAIRCSNALEKLQG